MYIGKEPIVGNFQKCDALTASATATYNLTVGSTAVFPESNNHVLVSLNGILQAPTTSYNISGSQIVFASALTSSDSIDFIILLGNVLDVGVPSDDTVGAAQIKNDLISGTTALASEPDDTDEFLVSDAGTLKRIDYSLIKGGGSLVKLASTTISSGVAAVAFDNNYITSTYDNYRIVAYGLSSASDNQDIALRMSVDNGSNFATHVGYFEYSQINNASTGSSANGVGNRSSIPFGSDEEADASGGTNFVIDMLNVNDTAQYTFCTGQGTVTNQSGPNYYGYRVGGYIASTTAVNYVKIFTEVGGNLDGGTVTLYGYEK